MTRVSRALAAALCLMLAVAGPARAQSSNVFTQPSTSTTAYTSATVGASHAQVLAANLTHLYLMLHNPSAPGGNILYCSFGGTATVAGAGTLSIAPGQYVVWESSYAPLDAIDCIASGAGTPMTIGVR